jgi:uncharacterized Rmd1/YagE family protein
MDCHGYCTASAYQIKPLFKVLSLKYNPVNYRDVIHIETKKDGIKGHAFFFPFASIVFWNVSEQLRSELLNEIKCFQEQPLENIETDEFTYIYGESARIVDDEITLPNVDILTKLSISHGIAQSVKLGTFETAIQKTFNSTKEIPEALAKKGKIPLSRKEIRRKMGQLFIERNSITLHVDVLDTPEFFWEYPELDPLYRMVANYLEIETRVEVLNHRLNVVHELFQMLGSELNHQHSSRLEWTIIILIVIEVILTLLKDVFKIL